MNGYSRITTTTTTHKSRSLDFSDFFSFPQTPKPKRNTAPTTNHRDIPEPEGRHDNPQLQVKKTKTQNCSSPEAEREDEGTGNDGERFGVILGRSGSVSSASGLQATLKRAFSMSMRRSSSVSERYCRIHDQYMAIASPLNIIGDEIDGDGRSIKKTHRGGSKIFRACKRLLGL